MSTMFAFGPGSSSEDSEDENDDFLHPSADPNLDDLEGFNPRKRRRTGRDAKESAALGIFGSESDDDGPRRRWKKKTLRSKGMAFVSTGHTTLNADKDDEEEEYDDDSEGESTTRQNQEDESMEYQKDEDVEENPAPQGLGFGGAASKGLRWTPSTAFSKPTSTPATPFGKGFVPSSAAAPVLLSDTEEPSVARISRPSAFSSPAPGNRGGKKTQQEPKPNAQSFAARMMAKMGYKEGQGLGKEGQGRNKVIEVNLRPQGVGLGAVSEKSKAEKEEEKRQAKLRGEILENSDEESKNRRRKPKTSGTDSGVSTPRGAAKPKFRTVEEIQKVAPGLQIPEAFAPILDMTGPAQRLLTSTSGLLTPTTGTESVEQVESKKLARRAQNDLAAFVEEWKNLEERKAYVAMEILQQEQEILEHQREYDQLKSVTETIQGVSQAVKDAQWDPVIDALKAAEKFETLNIDEDLSSLAVAAVHPFLRQAAEGWQPLEDPKLNGIAFSLSAIAHIVGALPTDKALTEQKSRVTKGLHGIRGKGTSPFESMIYKIIFPKIVSAINQSWDVHDPAPLQALFDAWNGLLPHFIRSLILDQAVVGKLNDAVSSWNPKKRRTHELPHLWLFPWLQYLPAHHADPKSSTGLVSDVKRKFRHLIDSWDFRKGVIPGLKQWREVLCPSRSNDQWTPLIMNHVLPAMGRFLKDERNFVIDPNDQAPYMSALQGIFAWLDVLRPRIIGQVIAEAVFPMWQSVLHQWLTVVGPNEEIGQWFEWWRDSVLPDSLKSLDCIEAEFAKGHAMIDHALDLGARASTDLPAPSEPTATAVPPAPNRDAPAAPPTDPLPQPQPHPTGPDSTTISSAPTLKLQVEDWCIENDLQFLPEKRVLHAAGPLYRVTAAANGKLGVLVYFRAGGGGGSATNSTDRLFATTKQDGSLVDVPIDWESPDGRDALLGMAWTNVK